MIRLRHLVPLCFSLVVAYLAAGPLGRLHLLFILLAKPAAALAIAGLLLFIIVRASDLCTLLHVDPSAAWLRCFVAVARRLHWPGQRDPLLPEAPSLTTLFQRPPPAFVL